MIASSVAIVVALCAVPSSQTDEQTRAWIEGLASRETVAISARALSAGYPRTRGELLHRGLAHPKVAVRRESLRILADRGEARNTHHLIKRARWDTSSRIRLAAAKAVTRQPKYDFGPLLAELLVGESSSQNVTSLLRLAVTRRSLEVVPAILQRLDSSMDPGYAPLAYRTLRSLSGFHLPDEPQAWRAWWTGQSKDHSTRTNR